MVLLEALALVESDVYVGAVEGTEDLFNLVHVLVELAVALGEGVRQVVAVGEGEELGVALGPQLPEILGEHGLLLLAHEMAC